MEGQPQRQKRGRGKFWRRLKAGDGVGRPLAEWAYRSPRFEDGITESDLREASLAVQRETALIWFLSNLEPYALGAGPYFGFARATDADRAFNATPLNTQVLGGGPIGSSPIGALRGSGTTIAGFGQAPFAPSRVTAVEALSEEFLDVVPESVWIQLASELAGDWMWRLPERDPIDLDGLEPTEQASLSAAILEQIVALRADLRALRPVHGEIGHNSPPEDLPLTVTDLATAEVAISIVERTVARTGADGHVELTTATDRLKKIAKKLATWTLRQMDTFITEANKSVAKKAATFLLAASVYSHLKALIDFLQRLGRAGLGH